MREDLVVITVEYRSASKYVFYILILLYTFNFTSYFVSNEYSGQDCWASSLTRPGSCPATWG